MDSDKPIGVRSLERLSHFNCGYCHKWWSIGDAPERTTWFCPWCGKEQEFGDVEAADENEE